MQSQAMALGYFFLSVFCIFTSANSGAVFREPLTFAAFLALAAGVGYIAQPAAAALRSLRAWTVQMVRLARETPSATAQKNTSR